MKVKSIFIGVVFLITLFMVYFKLVVNNNKFQNVVSFKLYDAYTYNSFAATLDDQSFEKKLINIKPMITVEGNKVRKIQTILSRAKYNEEGIVIWKGSRSLGILKFKDGKTKKMSIISDGKYFIILGEKGTYFIRNYDRGSWIDIISGKN